MIKVGLGTYSLYNLADQRWADAILYKGFDEKNVEHLDHIWKPQLLELKAHYRANPSGDPRMVVEDAHWNWNEKIKHVEEAPHLYETFVLECDGVTQAAMIVCKGGMKCISRHPEQERAPIIYIDYLSSAPWNRWTGIEPKIYDGCGRILVGAAVSLSKGEGYKGRIGLSALPAAVPFYHKVGCVSLGDSPWDAGLPYFELPTSQVANAIAGLKRAKGALQ